MGITRRQFMHGATALGLTGLAGGFTAGCQGEDGSQVPGKDAPPNIVLIVLDSLRADKLGCYGAPFGASVELDRLAERGVIFEQTLAQCSWTRPSIGSLVTSLHPRTVGLYKERDQALNNRFMTLPKLLKAHGYRTFGATANPNLNLRYNFHEGFDAYIESSVVFDWMGTKEGQEIRGHVSLPSAPWIYSQALDFAKSEGEGPGFIQINVMEVHEWYVRDDYSMIRSEYRDAFLDSGETYPKYLQATAQLTSDTVTFIDRLAKVPGWENTLFVLVSDHGQGLDDHPDVYKSTYHGRLLYESHVVVPWVLYHPQWQPKRSRVSQPVRLLEVMPTVLEFAGVPVPEGIAGRSVLTLATGAADEVKLPERFVMETHYRPTRMAVYDPAWKLFDNQPPHETLPRIGLQAWGGKENGLKTDKSEEHPEATAALRQYLLDWEEEYPAVPPTPTTETLSDAEREQLEAIGYLGE